MARLIVMAVVTVALGAGAANSAMGALYNLRASPVASFVWSPALPHVGDPITLSSTSLAIGSRIVRYSWDFSDNGPFGLFREGGRVASVSYATPAPHTVRLRVTTADGLSDVAAETIAMGQPPESAGVLYPFPVVSIRGRDFPFRVRITRLAVKAPARSRITVTCTHAHCPARGARRIVGGRTGHAHWTRLRLFERFFPAGALLEIRVAWPGKIGAYTRFHVRRRRFPTRRDSCLDPAGREPIACPA